MFRVASLAVCTVLAAGAAMAADPPTVKVAADSGFNVMTAALPARACPAAARASLTLRIGENLVVVPRADVAAVVPARSIAVNPKEGGGYEVTLPAAAGCPTSPLPAVRVLIKPGASVSAQGLMLTQTPPHEGLSATAQGLARQRDTGRCPETTPGLLRCEGTQQLGAERVTVVYLMAKDPADLLESQAPRYAVCRPAEGETLDCEVADDLAGDLTYRLMMTRGNPGLAEITAAHLEARAIVARLTAAP